MRDLEKALDTRFGNRFRGSKAQRKNAEKELQKLHAEADAEREAKKAARIQSLKEDIECLQFRLDNDYNGFWRELNYLPEPSEVFKELQEAKKELAELLC